MFREQQLVQHLTLERNTTVEKINLPQNWHAALNLVENISVHTGIKYVIVGSLGVSVTCNTDWEPLKQTGEERDLDVYILGSPEQRDRFHQEIISNREESMPTIDSHMLFGHHIIFSENKPFVQYKDIQRPIDQGLFQPTIVKFQGLNIPVLHPETHLELLNIYNRNPLPKIKDRMNTLATFIKNGHPGFTKIDNRSMEPMIQLQRTFEVDYKMREFKKYISSLKKNKRIGAVIDSLHNKFPDLWEKFHRMAEKD